MQVSWIDATQVTALAEGLRRAPTKSSPPAMPEQSSVTLLDVPASFVFPDDTSHESDSEVEVMVESEVPPAMHDFRARLQAIRDRAITAGLIPAHAPLVVKVAEVQLPPFQPKVGAVSVRIAAFVDWALPAFAEAEIFIVDDQGELHWGTPASSGLVLSAIMAWGAASRMSALAASEAPDAFRQILATGRHLVVIPAATRLGIMYIAITSIAPISESQISALNQALLAAIDAAD